MGYHTDFEGAFQVDRPLSDAHAAYLRKFNQTRRMKRDPKFLTSMKDPERLAVDLPIGDEGSYFVGGLGYMGQDKDESVTKSNDPPAEQPSLWCQWTPSGDKRYIQWDGGEKFYDYIEWIEYLIKHFLKPWGYVLNGEVKWRGEGEGDVGSIIIKDNVVTITSEEI